MIHRATRRLADEDEASAPWRPMMKFIFSSSPAEVRKTLFWEPLLCQKLSLYQDRLGTTTGKVEWKRGVLLQADKTPKGFGPSWDHVAEGVRGKMPSFGVI